ncbi:MAG: hypothetical protein EP298_13010 [Gammaproteobacteria bacterium]|nr:MAG: hypothetical protein EP298_13010 [Gammaproteobacteria bacterium]UTW41636.1 hypothetical protein KFE69_08965 [bacterium SCSIO 12844]
MHNNLRSIITIYDVEHHCYDSDKQYNLPLKVASGRTAYFTEAEDLECDGGYIDFKISTIYRSNTYTYHYKWNFDRDKIGDDTYKDPNYDNNKTHHYTYNKYLWFDLTDNTNSDPSVNQIMYVSAATCNNVDCSSSSTKYVETYEDDYWETFAHWHKTYGDPMYPTQLTVGYVDDSSTVKPEALKNLGNLTVTDGYGKIVPLDDQGYIHFNYHKYCEIHFSKTEGFCKAQWGKVSCPSSIERIEEGDELIFTCAQTTSKDTVCPWTLDES